MNTHSDFFEWLLGLINILIPNLVPKCLFIERPEVATFANTIGIALVIFSLSQRFSILKEEKEFRKDIEEKTIKPTPELNKYISAIRSYIKLLNVINGIGLLYFPAVLLILLSLTFKEAKVTSIIDYKLIHLIIVNLSYGCLFIATLYIAFYYFIYRLFRYNLKGNFWE